MMSKLNFSEQLRFFMELRGYSVSTLARATGIPKQTISNWTHNRRPRNLDELKRTSEILRTTLDNLLYGSGPGDEPKMATPAELDALLASGISGLFSVQIKLVKKG